MSKRVVLAALAAIFWMCGAQAADTVKVGVLLSLTGTYAAVAQTQQEGALLAIENINKGGGLDMPGGKVKVEGIVADDQAQVDVAVRRYRYLLDQGIKGLAGQTYAPVAYAINAMMVKSPLAYFPANVNAKATFEKGKLAVGTFAAAYSPWTVGWMDGEAAIKTLGKKRIYFLGRSDVWGWDIRDGLTAAAKKFGGEIVGYDEVPLGTTDFTSVLQKVRAAKPDVFVSAQFAADAVALLKQVHQMGLNKDMTIFNAFITDVVAKGIPAEALENVYALDFYYHDLSALAKSDPELVKSSDAFNKQYTERWGHPPDSYATIAYIGTMEMLRGFEKARSYDAAKVAAAVLSNDGSFMSVKGPARWRLDHAAEYKYAAFLVRGKSAEARKGESDLFNVVGTLSSADAMPTLKSLGY